MVVGGLPGDLGGLGCRCSEKGVWILQKDGDIRLAKTIFEQQIDLETTEPENQHWHSLRLNGLVNVGGLG